MVTDRPTMRRWTRDSYRGLDALRTETVPVPEPGPGQVLVRIVASSVNTADLEHLEGRPWLSRIGTGLRTPRDRVPGFDAAGVVAAVGPGSVPLRPGDRVWADLFSRGAGAFAPFVCAPAAAFAPLPDGVPFEAAAGVPHSGLLALQALTAGGGVRSGSHVLVNGGGGCVGPFAIQLAKHFGAEVTAVDDGARAELMRAAGADHVVDHNRSDVTRGTERFDVVVDIAAHRSFLAFRRILAPRGRYTLIARDVRGFVAAALLGPVLGGRRRIGVFGWEPNRRRDLDTLGTLLANGALRTITDRTFPLAEARDALEHVRERRAVGGKVVLLGEGVGSW